MEKNGFEVPGGEWGRKISEKFPGVFWEFKVLYIIVDEDTYA